MFTKEFAANQAKVIKSELQDVVDRINNARENGLQISFELQFIPETSKVEFRTFAAIFVEQLDIGNDLRPEAKTKSFQ